MQYSGDDANVRTSSWLVISPSQLRTPPRVGVDLALIYATIMSIHTTKSAFQNHGTAGAGWMGTMAAPLLPDDLWAIVEPLLPAEPPKPKGGRPRVSDRACLTGIIFVLKSGIPWEMLPQEMGCGSGVTCWRRLRDWQDAGVWDRVHHTLLDRLGAADQIDWDRAALDSASVPAKRGARPWDRIPPIAANPAPNAT